MPVVSIMLYLLWLCILVEIIIQSPLQKKFIYSQVLFIHWSVFRFEININNINMNIVPNYFSLTEYQNESAVYIDRSGSSFFCKVDSILISTSVHVFLTISIRVTSLALEQSYHFCHWNVSDIRYFTALHMWSEIDISIFAKSNIAIKYSTNMRNIYLHSRSYDKYPDVSYFNFIPQVKARWVGY